MRWAAAALLLWSACGDEPTASVDPVAPPSAPAPAQVIETRPLDVLFAGCRDVRIDAAGTRICEHEPDAELRLWAPLDAVTPITVTLDGEVVDVEPVAVEEGLRWVIPLPPSARSLDVHADLGEWTAHASLGLASTPRPIPTELAVLDQFEPAVALAKLDALLPSLDDEARATALERRADLAYWALDGAARTDAYAQAFAAAEAQGRLRTASTMAHRIADGCVYPVLDETCAQAWLDRAAPLVAHDPEMQLQHVYFRGLLAGARGDHRAALTAFEDSRRQASALDLPLQEVGPLIEAMVRIGRVGAWERAQRLQQRALALVPALPPRVRSQALNAVAWMWIEARARGRTTGEDPVPLLRRAQSELGTDDSEDARANQYEILLNLAYVAVLDERPHEARKWIEHSTTASIGYEDYVWRKLLLARVARLEGDLSAAESGFAALLEEGERRADPELRWQAGLGLAETLQARGDTRAALDGYLAAEHLLDEQLPRMAMGEGRARFVAERDRGTRRIVALQLQEGDVEAALCTARLARTRALRVIARQRRTMAHATDEQQRGLKRYRETRSRIEASFDASFSLPGRAQRQRQRELIQQRQDNERALDLLLRDLDPGSRADSTCDQLRAPAPRTLDLHFVRLDDGWVGLASSADGIEVRTLGPISTDATDTAEERARLSRALLEPFADAIAGAESIRVMPSGELMRVPFHALPIPHDPRGRVLLEQASVRYGLDLPLEPRERTEADRSTALVVGPPSALRHSAREMDLVSARLRATGFSVQRVEGDEATGARVREALPSASLLHYVGHAHADDFGGWSSSLALARDDRVEVGDVLTLARAPQMVVLNGCETGRTDPQAVAGGMSLAHAFVIAGAELVVAADGDVDDEAAAAFVESLYDAMARGESPSVALGTALLRRRTYDDGWVHIRGWVP